MHAPIFSCHQLDFAYQVGKQQYRALRSIDLTVQPQEFLLLMGPSGSGKSTLLNLLGLIELLQAGDIEFEGVSYRSLNEKRRNHLRRFKFGFIFQSFLLFEVLSAAENVEFFLLRQGLTALERKRRTQEALEMVGLAAIQHKRPHEMSGGQRQRVAIARALAKKPSIILADEPTANLDHQTGQGILQSLQDLVAAGVAVIMASHDPMARSFASRSIHLRDGQIDCGGTL